MLDDEKTYKILQFFKEDGKSSEVIDTGLTLEEAQTWCKDASTKGDDWFYGYTEE